MVEDYDLNDIVDVQIKKGTLSKTGVTLIIKENKDYDIIYGEPFWIEKYSNETHEFEVLNNSTGKECAFILPAYRVEKNKSLELKQDWSCEHGELEKGLYRLVKHVSFESDRPITEDDKYYIWVEFEIE